MLTAEQQNNLWPEIKLGLRNLWGRLTEEELDRTEGDLGAVAEIVLEKYSEGPEAVREKLDRLLESFDNDSDKGISPDRSSFERSPLQ